MAVELVLIDTVGTGRFTDMAGAAGEHELVGGAVLLGVKQVGAFAAEFEVNLIGLLGVTTGSWRRTGRHSLK